MIVAGVAIEPFGGALAGVVSNARASWAERCGLRVTLRDTAGRTGQGEASPLPGYSPETLDDARYALRRMEGLVPFEIDAGGDWRSGAEAAVQWIPQQVPSARFAWETALLDLIGQERDESVESLLGSKLMSVPWAAVVEASAGDHAWERVRALHASGVRHWKVKVSGADGLPRTRAFLGSLRELIGAGARLRIDANRSIPEQKLRDWLDAFALFDPEFVEEPAPWEAVKRAGRSCVPLALDESLQGLDAELIAAERTGYRYVVLKPTVLGGLLRCAGLARIAHRRGAVAVVSHTLEGPIAWTACAALAVSLGVPEVAAGLEPHAALVAWPAVKLPHLSGIRIEPQGGCGLGLPVLGAP